MNLAEYRHELSDAYRMYRAALQEASDTLEKRLTVADQEFLGSIAQEPVADDRPRYSRRDD